MSSDYNETWAREQDRLRGDPTPDSDEQPATMLRNCANKGCCSQNNRRALISRESGHDFCTQCQRFAWFKMLVAASEFTDWPDGTVAFSDIEMLTRRQYRGW